MRTSIVHYIAPSSISLVPNANGMQSDIEVTILPKTTIKVYCPALGIGTVDGAYQEWTFYGKNRRLVDPDKPYTIYIRLAKDSKDSIDNYLVFSPKKWEDEQWKDEHAYITPTGYSWTPDADVSGEWFPESRYWYIRIGDVLLPENGVRTLTFDTGILGTDQFNTEWFLNPDNLPAQVSLTCKINDQNVGLTPYVLWDATLNLEARLTEGWGSDAAGYEALTWAITRNSGDTAADAVWNADASTRSVLIDGVVTTFAASGKMPLSHLRTSDDFNGAVAPVFTITASWRKVGDGSSETVVLVQASLTVLAETVETYELALDTNIVSYNPATGGYTPENGVPVRVRATGQDGHVFYLTKAQFDTAQLKVYYAPVGSSGSGTELQFTGASAATARATLPVSAFTDQQNIILRLTNTANIDLDETTVAFVRDGEDSKEREWIFLRSQTALTFGTGQGETTPPSLIEYGEVDPTGAAGHVTNDSDQDGWVPEGWWDEPQGTNSTYPYEYGAYRDYVRENESSSGDSGNSDETSGGHWGGFTEPRIWSHFADDAVVYTICSNQDSIRIAANTTDKTVSISLTSYRRIGSQQAAAAYSCYWAAYRRRGTAVTRFNNSGTSKMTQRTLSNVVVSSDTQSANYADSIVVVTSKTSLSASSLQTALPTDYLEKIEIPVIKDGDNGTTPTVTIDPTSKHWIVNGTDTGIKAEGEDGTGIELKGSVDVVLNSDISGTQTSLEGVTGMQVGDCYMVIANGWLYFYDGTTPASAGSGDTPKNPAGWKPVGKIKGEPGTNGTTYYYHIAYADNITITSGTVTAQSGFTTVMNKDAYAWMGICTDTSQTDPGASASTEAEKLAAAQQYEWNKVQGASITKQSESASYAVTAADADHPAANSSDWESTKQAAITAYNQAHSIPGSDLAQNCILWTKTDIEWSDSTHTLLYSGERNPNDGAPGMSIVIDSQSVQYSKQSAGNLDPATLTYGSYPSSLAKGDWLYSRTTVVYKTSGGAAAGTTVSYSVSYIGEDGDNGVGISGITEHYKASANSTGETTPSGSSPVDWGTNPTPSNPAWDADHPYLWNYEKIAKVDKDGNTTYERTAASVVAIFTEDGAAGRGVDSITNYYAISSKSSGVTRTSGLNPGESWTTSIQVPTAEKPYLWNYEAIAWVNPTSTEYTAAHVIGHFGKDGTSPWLASQTNEMDSVQCDDTGYTLVGDAQVVSTKLALFHGSAEETFTVSGVTRNGMPITIGTATNGVTVTYDTASRVLAVSYAAGTKIEGKDEYSITIENAASSISRTLTFTVNGVRGDIYALLPFTDVIHATRSGNTYLVNGQTTVDIICGCTRKAMDGSVTQVAHVTTSIDGKYEIYVRRHKRSSADWENSNGQYIYWRYRSIYTDHLSTFSPTTYDALEFIICSNTGTSILATAVTGLIDRETIHVVADGQAGNDAYNVVATPQLVSFECDSEGQSIDTDAKEVQLSMYKGSNAVSATMVVASASHCTAWASGSKVRISTGMGWRYGGQTYYTHKPYPYVAVGDDVFDVNGQSVGVVTGWGATYIKINDGSIHYDGIAGLSYESLAEDGYVVVTITGGSATRSHTIPVVGNRQGAQGIQGQRGYQGPEPRRREWAEGLTWQPGGEGDNYADVCVIKVTEGADAGTVKAFVCINALDNSGGTGSVPTSECHPLTGTNRNNYWAAATDEHQFVATDFLLSDYILAASGRFDGLNVNYLKVGKDSLVGGFIYNEPRRIKKSELISCPNPLDYGAVDRILSESSEGDVGSGLYNTRNILFPDCGSSIILYDGANASADDDLYALCYTNNVENSWPNNRININLPFYAPFSAYHYPTDGSFKVIAHGDVMNAIENSHVFDNAGANTAALLNQLQNGYNICFDYLGTSFVVQNRLHDHMDVIINGVRGVVEFERYVPYYGASNHSFINYLEYEPWNRGTILWEVSDAITGQSPYIAREELAPSLAEMRRLLENTRPLFIGRFTQLPRISSGTVDRAGLGKQLLFSPDVAGRYDNGGENQLGGFKYVGNGQPLDDNNMLARYVNASGTYNSRFPSRDIPFRLPAGYFVRLTCTYEEAADDIYGGYYYWRISEFGRVPEATSSPTVS